MAEVLDNITVAKLKRTTMERKDGTGTFEAVEITTSDGLVLSGYGSSISPDLKEGDVLANVNIQSSELKNGTKLNKIISVGSPSKSQQKRFSAQSNKKPFDSRGAQVGGILHDAVSLAIHNAGKNQVTTEMVKELALELIQVSNDLQKK